MTFAWNIHDKFGQKMLHKTEINVNLWDKSKRLLISRLHDSNVIKGLMAFGLSTIQYSQIKAGAFPILITFFVGSCTFFTFVCEQN